jgi:lipopolysaccharide biosynthesis protein
MGHTEEAISCYRQSYGVDENRWAALELRALGIALEGRIEPAAGASPFPGRPGSLVRLLAAPLLRNKLVRADEARDRRDWLGAALLYGQYLQARPHAFAIWVQLGHALKEAGRKEESLGAYERALALDRENADLLLSLGHVNKLLGRFDEAERYYSRSAAIEPLGPARGELRRLVGKAQAPGTPEPTPNEFGASAPPTRGAGSPEPPPHPVGYVERLEGTVVVGWACDPRAMGGPAKLEFRSGDAVVCVAETHMVREDVEALGFGSAPRGFGVDLSEVFDETQTEISIWIADSAWELEGSPVKIRHPQHRRPLPAEICNRSASTVADPDRVAGVSDWRLPNPSVRTVAFYLPQFHPFRENDAWWGRGFTEWTNVTRGKPQFAGHYQPHRPGELGYYDLRVPEIQHRQVELARRFGVSAFCFYFYWFSGRTLMERPIRQFADDAAIDFPFCLCWANENWTRRWDGLDSEQLIGQNHSPDDDLAFIAHVAEYMSHRNYVRVDGRPVLVVYRAELLPDPAATARRWRDFCRSSGLGDIYLVCTHAFTTLDPRDVGFDAALQFPPNNTGLSEYEGDLQYESSFVGMTFNYAESVTKAETFSPPMYPLVRSAYPAWDNTARRGHAATIFMNSSPPRYRRYLETVVRQTIEQQPERDNRLVFVNAWNEWAEGAHLEPDERYGYAHLEATRMALVRAAATPEERRLRFGAVEQRPLLVVIIHAFYLDVLPQILTKSASYDPQAHFVFTTPHDKVEPLKALLDGFAHSFEILGVENRGRDVAPFLQALTHVWARRFRYVLKLHTKKSTHRSDGDRWLSEFLVSIADPQRLSAIMAAVEVAGDVGIVGPASQVVSLDTYWGSNADRVRALARRLGVDDLVVRDKVFIAGTMFLARLEALEPLMALSLTTADFEPEEGQVDGTLGHAIERVIGIASSAVGLKIAGSEPDGQGRIRLRTEAVRDFAFAIPTLAEP